jgi:hypothetical protein
LRRLYAALANGSVTEVPSTLALEQNSNVNKTCDAAPIIENVETTSPPELAAEVEGVAKDVNARSVKNQKKGQGAKRQTLKETLYRDTNVVINTTAAFGEEMLVLDDHGHQVVVNNFHTEDWELLETESCAPADSGLGGNMCGIWALLGLLHNQALTLYGLADDHLLKAKMRNMTWDKVYAAVDNQRDNVQHSEGTASYYSEEQLALGLQELDAKLRLVVVGSNLETENRAMARRATGTAEWNQTQLLETGYNLYIYHSGNSPLEHWQAMKRIDKPA